MLAVFGLILCWYSQRGLERFIFRACKITFPLPQAWFCVIVLSGFCSYSSGLLWSACSYELSHSSRNQMNCSCLWNWLLYTWWRNFPPPLIVAMKGTSVKYGDYCISVYTYILIQVDTSVWGNHQQPSSRWKLSLLSFSLSLPPCLPFSFTLPLPHSLFCMLSSSVACLCMHSYSHVFVSVGSCKLRKCDTVRTGLFRLRDRVTGCHACRKLRVASAHMDLNAAY